VYPLPKELVEQLKLMHLKKRGDQIQDHDGYNRTREAGSGVFVKSDRNERRKNAASLPNCDNSLKDIKQHIQSKV